MMLLLATAASAQYQLTADIYNPGSKDLLNTPVCISLEQYQDVMTGVVFIDGKEIPSQLDDLNRDGAKDEICFLVDVPKHQTIHANITLIPAGTEAAALIAPQEYTPRTYAEIVLRNPAVKEKNRHDIYLDAITADRRTANSYNVQHHHGVAFENELIAVRIYFDQRQTLDLYGKFSQGLELEQTQFYTSPEQKQQGYGDDVLWVGNSFGLGALRGWNGRKPTMISNVERRTQRIISSGPVRTVVEVEDEGWIPEGSPSTFAPLNMTIRYTLYAGHRDIDVCARFNRNVKDLLFSTGVINVKGSQEFSDHKGLRGCWGTDWPASDTLNWKKETVGLGILVPQEHMVSEVPATQENYAFVIRPNDKNQLCYKLTYTSNNEHDFGVHSDKAWFEWLKAWRKETEQPVRVNIR
ncbi:MAG: DUF4861 domain-containing protein [Prevotella sp.]|nr:DUF4861 domain-containing protein [Prevotella sp.]